MGKKTICYRGSLKSCNYRCSYCPFSKHRASARELEKDREDFGRFCRSVATRGRELCVGAVFVVPYGEASIHAWYWEGLGRLAALPGIDRVGLQTNLSFSVEECLKIYDSCSQECSHADGLGGSGREQGAYRQKLCVWATFHPEMTDVDTFAEKAAGLAGEGVNVCAGAVGVPQNIPLLNRLREKLPPDIYLWINKMDGLGRGYTGEERKALCEIDPFFTWELGTPAADASMCADRCFVEAGGKVRCCNIGRTKGADWYQGDMEEIFRPSCGKSRCSCFLAYGGRRDFEGRKFFGDYPLFRIPEKRKGFFLDLDGTLVPEGGRGGLSEGIRRKIRALGETYPVFLATSMPEEEVRKRIRGDMDLFWGGIFASGAHVCLWARGGGREAVHPVELCLPRLMELANRAKAKVRIYQKNGVPYKATVFKRHKGIWKEQEIQYAEGLSESPRCRVFVEKNCLEIIGKGLDKGTGIREICGWLGIEPREAMAVGNDREDEAMAGVCGAFLARPRV